MAGAHQGPRLLTALPPDPGTLVTHRAPEIPSQSGPDTAPDSGTTQ